ncbi:MAG: aspartyl protease family protein [Parvularculaceae bacterium]
MTRLLARYAALFAALWAFLLAGQTAQAATEPVVRAPYRLDYGGWYTVAVTIDGEGPYDFIIDTGATHSLVFENLASQKNFPLSGDPLQRVLGVSSEAMQPTYVVGDIALGPAVLNNAHCVILPDWTVRKRSPHGVLGLDFMASYQVVFDAENHEIRLYAATAEPEAQTRGWSKTRLKGNTFDRDFGEMFVVEGRLNRKRTRFLVDLGASGTVINGVAAGKTALLGDKSISVNPMRGATRLNEIKDANDTAVTAQPILLERLMIGRTIWKKQVVVAHNAQIFEELGVQRTPFGLLGTDLLRDRSFVLDFPGGKMLIGPKAAGQS